MQKIAIIHYLPLEYYPPVTNLLDYLESNDKYQFDRISIFSCKNVKGRKPYASTGLVSQSSKGSTSNQISNFGSKRSTKKKSQSHNFETAANELVAVKRSPFPKESDSNVIRLYKYLHFNIRTLIGLITSQPNNLLYFESYSAWPAYIYTKYFNRKCRIFIHNHEYADKGWYRNTMKQVKYFHQLEKKWLYPRAQWISQTNSERLQLFHSDHPYLKKEQLKIMPNYPPSSWQHQIEKGKLNKPLTPMASRFSGLRCASKPFPLCGTTLRFETLPVSRDYTTLRNLKPLKLVYVGSLSLLNTYLKEFCNWVIQKNGQALFDIYAYNLHQDTTDYLESLNSSFIHFFDKGLEYNYLPHALSQYDVGVIMYKAYSENVINCVSNKFYEYQACNLDVWFSDVMKSTHAHVTTNTYPKVIPVDFEKLDAFNWQQAVDKRQCEYKPSEYFCEEVYEELINELMC